MKISSYLFFNGNCEAAFKFYEQQLGGRIEQLMRYADAPGSGQSPPDWAQKVMHISMQIDGQTLMASDAPPDRYQKPQGFSLSLEFTDLGRAETVFNGLAIGGSIQMPFEKTFWAERFGMLVDQFGIAWMVNCPPSPAN